MREPLVQFSIDDRSFDPVSWTPASRKRVLLAVYIDYLLVGSIWALIQFLITQFVPVIGALPPWGRWVLFGILEISVFRFNAPSLGALVLSIRRFSCRGAGESGKPARGRLWFVDSWTKKNETWFSMIVAFLFLSDGVKTAVRWTMWNPPQPLFGVLLNEASSTIAYVSMGAIGVWLGYLLFTLHRRAVAGALAYSAGYSISIIMSWDLWDPFVAELITRRENYLGTGRAAERIQTFQAMIPELFIAGSALMLALLGILAYRYRKLPARPARRERTVDMPRDAADE